MTRELGLDEATYWSYQLVRPMSAPSESAAEACARALRAQILGGTLGAGARLPPERELSARFGVNRVTVRAALARLEAEHLVTVRQGSGYTVRPWRRTGGPDLIASITALAAASGDRAAIAEDLLLVRRQLARAVLERLADGVSERALAAIAEAVDRLEDAAHGGDPVAIARADLEVAGALVDATGSAVLALCMNPVASLLGELPELRDAMFREPLANVAAWRALVAWLAAGSRDGIEPILAALRERDEATIRSLPRASEENA